MREINASTAKGKEIIARALRYDGYFLSDVYDSYSAEKAKAYNRCYWEFLETENHAYFAICSHDSFGFTCSWWGTKDGERFIRYETKDNSYLVWLDI